MNKLMKDFAKSLAKERIMALESLSYSNLRELVNRKPATEEVSDADGNEYQIDTSCFIEDRNTRAIRVRVAVFTPKDKYPWWLSWKNIDSALVSEGFTKSP